MHESAESYVLWRLWKHIYKGRKVTSSEFLFRAITVTRKLEYLRRRNVPISYQRIRVSILQVVQRAGLDATKIGTHSLRAGGASAAANNGIEDRLFKRHGRWRSERAKDGYVEDDLTRRLSVTRSLGLTKL